MKRKGLVNLLFTIALILLIGSTLFACANDDIHNLKATSEIIELPLNGSLPITNYITYEGKGKLNYSVENTDVLLLKGERVTAIAVGTGKIVVATKDETITITVRVVDRSQINVEAIDTEEIYDGTVKNIIVDTSDLPDGSLLKYYVGEQEFFGTDIPDTYLVTVEAVLPQGYNANYIRKTANLVIKKAKISNTARFVDKTFVYDGQEKQLLISGDLPDNVSVSYSNNKAVNAGTYKAVANFTVDTRYYEEIQPLVALLVITKAKLNYSTLGFENKTIAYTGGYHYIAFESLPEGIYANYYLNSIKEENKIQDITNGYKDVGVYKIIAEFVANDVYNKNYVFESQVTATLEITKANFINNLTWNDVPTFYLYDGDGVTVGDSGSVFLTGAKPVGVNGEFPDGVNFTYHYKASGIVDPNPINLETNKKINVGTYTVIARFIMPEGYIARYNKLEDMEFSFTINKASYNMENVTFLGDTFTFDGTFHTFVVERPEAFDVDVKIQYTVFLDDQVILSKSDTPYAVKNAGNYKLVASFTYNNINLVNNYLSIEAKTINVKVNKLAVNLGNAAFLNKEFTYEKDTQRKLEVENLPENVVVSYSDNNLQTNAGVYLIDANFSYYIGESKIEEKNFYFTQYSKVVSYTRQGTLTIKKATHSESEIAVYNVLGGVYSPSKKLSNYVILNEDNEPAKNITWANPDTIPRVDNLGYLAYYNADPANYENYRVTIDVQISKATIDGQNVSIENQFLKRTGNAVVPYYKLNGVKDDLGVLKVVAETTTPLVEWGKYPIKASFELADSINYEFINVPIKKDITIYIYNGAMFDYEGTQLIKYKGGEATVLEIPDGTTRIYYNAIASGANITEIILPSTLIKSGLPNGAINIGQLTSLSKITIPFVGVNGNDTFASLLGKTNGNLPSNFESVTVTNENVINKDAFKDCKYIRNIIYQNNVLSVGENAFNGCKELRTLTIGTSMTSIGQNAFRQCVSIVNLSLPFIGNTINDTTNTISYLIGKNLEGNLYTTYSLSTLTITGNVQVLPDLAFAQLKNVGTIKLPDTIMSIGKEAFSGTAAKINLNDNITEITERMFYNYEGTQITLPSAITRVGAYAFYDANMLASMTLPKSVASIGEFAFSGVKCNVLWEQGTTIETIGQNAFNGYLGSGFVIPSTVTSLGNYAFGKSGIINIIIPASIITLGEGVFQESIKLNEVTLYNKEVGVSMFAKCKNLTSINFENVEVIGNNAFENCTSLLSVLLKANVVSVGRSAFYGCTAMNDCEIKANKVITLYDDSFIKGMTIRVFDQKAYNDRYYNTTSNYQFFTWN